MVLRFVTVDVWLLPFVVWIVIAFALRCALWMSLMLPVWLF